MDQSHTDAFHDQHKDSLHQCQTMFLWTILNSEIVLQFGTWHFIIYSLAELMLDSFQFHGDLKRDFGYLSFIVYDKLWSKK